MNSNNNENETDFEIKDPLVEEEYDNETVGMSENENDENMDEQKPKREKREKKPKLSSKHENFMAFGHWFISNLSDDDFDKESLFNALLIRSDLNSQTAFFDEFTTNIKEHKKSLKLKINPKKITKTKKNIVINLPIDEPQPVQQPEPEPVQEPEPEPVQEPEPEPVNIIIEHVQLALNTEPIVKKTKELKAPKEPKEPKEAKEPKEPKAPKEPKEPKEAKEPKEPKAPKAPKEPKVPKEDKK
jgi:hypothetical protein